MDTARKTPVHFCLILLFAAGVMSFTGCNKLSGDSNADSTGIQEANIEDEGVPLYYEMVGFGQSTAIVDTIETVIRDNESLRAFEQQLKVSHPFRNVDFDQAVVLLVAVPVPTGGYSVEFATIDQFEDGVVAQYIVSAPGSDCITPMGQSAPYVAALIPRTENEIRFEHQTEEIPCTFK